MRVDEGKPLTRAEARDLVDSELQFILEGGEYTFSSDSGISSETDAALGQVYFDVLSGTDPAASVTALWVAFDAIFEDE